MEESVKVISNGITICEDAISESVRKGAYNTTNWHKYSTLIVQELKKRNNVTFFINESSQITFGWHCWLNPIEASIFVNIMMIVHQRFSSDKIKDK